MSIQTHRSHENEVRNINDREHDHLSPGRELRAHEVRDVQREEQAADSREQEPLRQRVPEEDEPDQIDGVMRPPGDDEAEHQTRMLRDEVVRDLADEEKGKDAEALVDPAPAVWRIRPDERHVHDRRLRPALCPSHALLPERHPRDRCHLVGDDVHVVHGVLALPVRAQGGVNVLGQHRAVHLVAFEEVGFPVSVGSAEEAEAVESAATGVRDGVDFVEFQGDHLGDYAFVGVVDDAAALDNVDAGVFCETLGCPARVVWVRKVVAVEDPDYIGPSIECEEMVEIVGLGLGIRNLGDYELRVQLLHAVQFGLQWFD